MKPRLVASTNLAQYWGVLAAAEYRVCRLGIDRLATPRWKPLFVLVSRAGNGGLWVGVLALIAALPSGGMRAATHVALTAGVGILIYRYIKSLTARERPCVTFRGDLLAGERMLDRYSFPSGHTLHALLFVTMTLTYVPTLGLLLVPFVVAIALSRVVLGLHYPTDVIAGAVLGTLIAQASLWVFSPV